MDIRNLGNFANIEAVWVAYPNGGIEGDYLFIPNQQGTKYRWNKYIKQWENAAVVTETTGRQDFTVSDLQVQNEVHVGSHADVHGDLRVQGVLRARHVKQPNVGLFATLAALQAAYPTPEVGMWAVIGDAVPGYVYRCNTAGTWEATGETGGVDELEGVVLYGEQELTEAEKKQARANMGFGDGDIDDVPTVGSENVVTSGGVKDAVDDLQEKLSTEKSARIAADNAESAARQSAISQQNAEIASFEEAVRTQISDYRPIVIEGDAVNAPDEEDLTSVTVGGTDVLKLKNRNSLYGMGYIILRRGSSFASQLTQANTIYEIRYDYSLGTERTETLEFSDSTTVVTDEYKDATDALEEATDDYNEALADLTTKQDALTQAQSVLTAKEAILTQKELELEELIEEGATEEEIEAATQAVDAAQEDVDTAQKAVDDAQDAVDEAQEAFDAAELAKDTAQDVLDNTPHYYSCAQLTLAAGECFRLTGTTVGINDARTAKSYNKGSVIYADTDITVNIGSFSGIEAHTIEHFVRIPANSIIKFEGGSISNGILHSDEAVEIVSTKKCLSNIKFEGKCKQSLIADLRWFVDKYPTNTSDTTIDNTQEVIQCLNCGTRSVLFPTDKFIRLTQTVEVNQQINILTDNKDKQMFAGFSSNIRRQLEIPCVFSEQVVTLFKYHLGAFDGYGEKYNEPFIIGNINLVTTKPYSTISLDPESSDYRGTPVLYIDNKYAKVQVWGIKLNCNIASKTCSVPIDLNASTTKKTGYNWTGIDIRTVPDVYTSTCHAFAFLEINGDIYNLAMGFVTSKGDDGTNGWFNDVIVRGHIECSFGCDSKCGGPLVIYGTHQTRRMHSSLLTQKGYFKSSYIYMFGWVWDCDNSVDSNTKWVRANSQIEATTRNASRSFTPEYKGASANDYRFPNPVIIGEPITDNRDLRKFPNLLYYGLGGSVSNILTGLDYSIQFVGEEDFVPSLYTGRIINEHCLFNDAMASPYSDGGAYPALGDTKLDVAYTTSYIYKVKVSFDLTIYSRESSPTFLLIGNQIGTDRPSIKQAKIAIKTRSTKTDEWTILYSEENPLVLGSFHRNYFDRYWRVNLPKLGMSHYSHISIEVDYSDPKAKSRILPFISIPWFYGDVPKYRDCENDKLPVIYKYNRGWNTFNRDINKPIWWDGTTWVNANGHAMAAKTIGTTAERPVGKHQETIGGETVTVGTLTQNDNGFMYFDTDLKKPIYALSINTTTTGEVVWADADGQPLKWTNKEKITLNKKKRVDTTLRFSPTGDHSGETVQEFIDRIEITTVSDAALLTGDSNTVMDAKIIDASAGDAIQIKGVSSQHLLMYYVISKQPHTGINANNEEYTYYKLTACGPTGKTESPSKPYEYLIDIVEDSWVILEAYNEYKTKDGSPYPYSNNAAIPYEFIHYSNDAAVEIPTYGIMDNAPTALLGSSNTGFVYFATDLGTSGKPVFWNGSEWVDASGTVV